MTLTETQADLRINVDEVETEPLRIEDWLISTSDETSVASDVELQKSDESRNTEFEQIAKKVRPIRKDTGRVSLQGDIKTLVQQWECVVLATDDETVQCEMHDLSNELNPVEFADVLWSEFNEYDKPLLKEGAVFYWSIGHLKKPSGQVRRFSETRLRRMPKIGSAIRREISRKVKILDGLCS